MRPEILFPLFAPLATVRGVWPKTGRLIAELAGPRVLDLVLHLPSGLLDRRYAPRVAEARAGAIATLTVRVEQHLPPRTARMPYKVRCADDSGALFLVFFHARPDYLTRVLPLGEVRVVSGTVEHYGAQVQITHPDHIGPLDELSTLKAIEPTYPLRAGLGLKPLARAIQAALQRVPALPEWQDPCWRERHGWPDFAAAVRAVHAPQSADDLLPQAPARARLAYDELLSNQLALALIRVRNRAVPGRTIRGDGRMRERVIAALPYRLTAAQDRALAEISADMARPTRMLRLLQGDVGSGKTVAALMAMLIAVEAGAQAALMAPTEMLARQHHAALAPLAARAGVRIAVLTGRDRGRERAAALAELAGGAIHILVGTHALFQDEVTFRDLALIVIDEQHRFGVHQRLALSAKGGAATNAPDMLVMTATPIPRTLTLTAYGDMDVSRLIEKPPGRRRIATRALPASRLSEVVAAMARRIASGDRVYWVCPLVSESETTDLAAAVARREALATELGRPIGLVHGRMPGSERDAAIAAFTSGATPILVATTVIEVGIDVPEATTIVIEQAERFGLAQLHQLRGRVGRSDRPSSCLLLYATPLGEAARARLRILRETDDGFRIAEEDLRLRGPGEVLGTRQSGLPEFRIADLSLHADLLSAARDDSALVLARDPMLTSPRGEALRVLLYLFERDAAVAYLRSG
ncbi:MAG: ATP-dependent DNA helicase RecG [Alphaproteobacteria bacterium]|nr:ATP-dependent DNA helicase RecG [Alphaproteobacteria bacterium]